MIDISQSASMTCGNDGACADEKLAGGAMRLNLGVGTVGPDRNFPVARLKRESLLVRGSHILSGSVRTDIEPAVITRPIHIHLCIDILLKCIGCFYIGRHSVMRD